MKRILLTSVLSLTIAFGLTACGGSDKPADPQAELERASEALQAAPAPAPAPAQQQPTAMAQPQTEPAAAPAQMMNQAMSSYKAGNYEDAIVRLQKLRASTAVTPQQTMAIQDAMASVMAELYDRAAKGDARAAAAIKQHQALRNQRQ